MRERQVEEERPAGVSGRVELQDPGDSCVSQVSQLDTKMSTTDEGLLRKRLNGPTPASYVMNDGVKIITCCY